MIASTTHAQVQPWVTCYIGGWNLNTDDNGSMPLSAVDFSAMTVADHMAILPSEYSPFINTNVNGMTAENSRKLIAAAHAAGTKATVTVGSWNTEGAFRVACAQNNLAGFVSSIVSFVKDRGYDGVDIDWEPLTLPDTARYASLIRALRAALPSPKYLLTTTGAWGEPYGVFADIQEYVDQINLMTYDLSWASPGYNTWYNGCVYSNGVTVPGNGLPAPSCDYIVGLFEDAGVNSSKLGIGSLCGGTVWKGGVMRDGKGVTGPNQAWVVPPTVTSDVPLYSPDGKSGIMQKYFEPQYYHWDQGAEAAYLSIDSLVSFNDYFISFDDASSISAKFAYVRKKHLGGIMLYELGMAYPGHGTLPILRVVKSEILENAK